MRSNKKLQSSSNNGNRDLDVFFGMLQDRARDIKMRNRVNRKSNLDVFGSLPRDIVANILSRLSIPYIMECKAVCKAWRDVINCDLIKCGEFGKRHRHLAIFPRTEAFPRFRISSSAAPNYIIEKLNDIPMTIVHMGLLDSVPLVRSSVDGLILLLRRHWTDVQQQQQQQQQQQHLLLWVCNPITREYVRIPHPWDTDFGLGGLPFPPLQRHPVTGQQVAPRAVTGLEYNFGFGVSKTSKQHKLVWISQSKCRVYTLGTTGQWRSIGFGPTLLQYNEWNTECAFVGGNLHWLDPPETLTLTQTKIVCFDLETEAFTYIPVPPPRYDCCRSLCVLDDCLCLCDVYGDEIEIWLMMGRGDWRKKLVINEQRRYFGLCYGHLFPIKVLEDGGMLLADRISDAIHDYSNNNNNNNDNDGGPHRRIRRIYPSGSSSSSMHEYPRAAVYTPSFLSLKTMLMDGVEDVGSF